MRIDRSSRSAFLCAGAKRLLGSGSAASESDEEDVAVEVEVEVEEEEEEGLLVLRKLKSMRCASKTSV